MLILNAVNACKGSSRNIDAGSEWKVLAMSSDKTLIIEEVATEVRLRGVSCKVFDLKPEDILVLLEHERLHDLVRTTENHFKGEIKL